MTDTIHSGSSPPLRILLIDDEEEILATVGQLLRRMGYEVSTASNGAEGLERFERDGADIVVSDVMWSIETPSTTVTTGYSHTEYSVPNECLTSGSEGVPMSADWAYRLLRGR
jgi:CheY-like chemotaxis protein